jgi:2-iminobutanoate/2-iminopropanoate deaminase
MSRCQHEKKIVTTDQAPKALGPYSAGVSTGCMVFTAGQVGIDPATGKMVEGGVQAQTRQALINIKAILEAAGSSLDLVVKTTVFLQDWDEFALMNEVYASFFSVKFPARSGGELSALPLGAAVEIDAIALLPCERDEDEPLTHNHLMIK